MLRTGVGFDCIDVPAATDNGIAIINVPDLWTREVANQAMMLLLAANRKLLEQVQNGDATTGGRRAFRLRSALCTPRRSESLASDASVRAFRAANQGIRGGDHRL